MKNKKGALLYAPMLLILMIAGLIYAYSEISARYKEFNKEIGEKQFELINTYHEGEKALFYIDQSAKYSSYQAIYDLAKSGGCSSGDKYSGYRLWEIDSQDPSKCKPTSTSSKSSLFYFISNNLNNYMLKYIDVELPLNNYDFFLENGIITGTAKNPLAISIIGKKSNFGLGTYIIKAPFKVNIENYDFSDYDTLRLKAQEFIDACNDRVPFICLTEISQPISPPPISPPPISSGIMSCPIENPTISCGSLGSGSACEHCSQSYRSRAYYNLLCNQFPRTEDGIDVIGPGGLDTYSATLPYINGQVVQWKYEIIEHATGSQGAGKTFTATEGIDTYRMYMTHLEPDGPGSVGDSFQSGTSAGNLKDDIDGQGLGHTHIQIMKNGNRVNNPEIELGMCS